MKRRQSWLLLLVTLAAFALRLYRLDAQDIWWDEARNIDVAGRPLAQIATAPELDIHPPVYFYLLHGWMALTGRPLAGTFNSAFTPRFLSLWFGVLLVPLMGALGRRVGGGWVGLGAALAAAFLPFLLGEAQETRMYTMVLVWLAAGGYWVLGIRDWRPIPDTQYLIPGLPAGWAVCALFSALALLTHYAALFALSALWGWAIVAAVIGDLGTGAHATAGTTADENVTQSAGLRLWHSERPPDGDLRQSSGLRYRAIFRAARSRGPLQGWPRVRGVLLAGLLTAVLCLPGLPVALRQIPSYRNPNLTVPTVGAYLAELARVYGLGEHIDPIAARPWQIVLAVFLAGGLLLAFVDRLRHRQSPIPNPFFALSWAILPLVIYYLVIRDRATFASRYISVALPGWLLLMGLALRGWGRVHRGLGGLAAVGLVIALVPGLIGDLTDPRFFREDTRGLVAWLKTETTPDDLLLVDQRYPFGFYYERWNNAADGFPPAEPASLAPAQYLFVDINTVADRLTALAWGRHRVFWVRWFESDTDPRGAVPFLLEKFGTPLGERAFRGYTVTWYAIAADTRFELAQALVGFQAGFGDQVQLMEAAFGGRGPGQISTVAETRAPVAPADRLIWATIRWARLPGAAQPLKATLMLEDPDGLIVGRDDRPILNDRHLAPPHWSATDQPLGVYLVRPDPGTPPGTYTLKLAVYDPQTLAKLPVSLSPPGEGQQLPPAQARPASLTPRPPFPPTLGGRGAEWGAGQADSIPLGQVELTRATVPPAAAQLPLTTAINMAWGGLRLLGRGPLPAEVSPGDTIEFDLYWQAERSHLPDLRVRLALADAEGRELFSMAEGVPVGGRYPTSAWAAGEIVRDHRRWRLDPATPPGAYRVLVTLVAPGSEGSPAVELGQIVEVR